jgi:cytochrome c peroxidase
VPQLRGLAAHAPFFHDGSAQDLASVVNFYNSRFNINFTSQEKQDLIQFLRTL